MGLTTVFKKTDLGLIPDDWEVKTIRQLGFDISDGNYSSKYPKGSDFRRNGVPFIRANNIRRMTVVDDDMRFISSELHQELQKGHLKAGDLLITTRGEIGQLALVPETHIGSNINAQIVRINPGNTGVDHRFLAYSIASESAQEQLSNLETGSALKQLPVGRLVLLRLAFPNNIEQRAIATALSEVDGLIAGLEKLIAKKRDLKQAAMQQLLTGQTRLPGFSGEWARNDLKNLVSTPITDGPHLTPTFYETGVPFLSVNNLANNRIDWSDLRFISKADDEIFSRKCKPRTGDVLLGKAASVGKVAIVEDDFDFNIWSPIALIRSSPQVDAKFLYYQLLSADCITQVMLLTNSSSQGNIGMGDIEKIQISYPDLEEQTAIAKVLSDMDAELTVLESRITKTRDLKQGMMQELLTGRTRLV